MQAHTKPPTTDTSALFSGKPNLLGGLSNERELIPLIPEEFKEARNPWAEHANHIFFSGANPAVWSWKSDDPDERNRQRACLTGALTSWDLSHEQKEALCGWMLSEMLTEVPS